MEADTRPRPEAQERGARPQNAKKADAHGAMPQPSDHLFDPPGIGPRARAGGEVEDGTS